MSAIPAPAKILKYVPLPDRISLPLRQLCETDGARGKWTVARLLSIPGFGLGSLHEILRNASLEFGRELTPEPRIDVEDEVAAIVANRKQREQGLKHYDVLDRVIEIIRQGAPASEKVTLANIEAARLSRGELRLSDIERACRFRGDAVPFRILRRGEMTLVVTPSQFANAERVQTVAVRTVASWGAARIAQLAEHADVDDKEFVTRVVQAHSEFQWLDERTGWFWFASPRSRLVRAIQTAQVEQPVSGIEALAFLLFSRRPSEFVLPVPVLSALIAQLPNLCAT